MSDAIDHVDLVVSSLEVSLPVYRDLLAPLGLVREGEIVGERGERVVYLMREGGPPGAVGLRERQAEAAPERYAIGLHHLALAAASREQVDAVAEVAARLGLESEGEPREYAYSPGYYAVFIHDPDGLKLEVVHAPRAG